MPVKKTSRSREAVSGRSWELQEIQQLIDLLIEREISEFEMEKDGMRVRIMRRAAGGVGSVQSAPGNSSSDAASSSVEQVAAPSQPQPQEVATPETTPEVPSKDAHVLKSPIVGTFFAAPAPDAPPFVNVGDIVHVGQVLCIVEAMKLMNEIESEFSGEIVRIHVENGQPVEYGQPLFTIKPS
ncbi:MAG: acetyl-CoA carboxylase biotin carboxyl carrier protein [Acidobacteriota bacterium]